MKQKLPISTRDKSFGDYMPGKDALLACFQLATSSEAALYLLKQFEKRLQSLKMERDEKCAKMLARVAEFSRDISFTCDNREDPWQGGEVLTDFQNLQHNLSTGAAQLLKEKLPDAPLSIAFAINEVTNFVRGFSAAGKDLPPQLIQAMDKLCNAYFAENNLLSQGGAIYEATDMGVILRDKEGNPVRAKADKVKQLIKEGLADYLSKKGLEAKVEQQAFPKPATPPPPQIAAAPASSSSPSASSTETPTPDEPASPNVGGM